MADIRKLNTADADFQRQLDALLAWESVSDGAVNQVVHEVIGEIDRWQRRVRLFRGTRGHALLWNRMRTVRQIRFTGIETIALGSMTDALAAGVPSRSS